MIPHYMIKFDSVLVFGNFVITLIPDRGRWFSPGPPVSSTKPTRINNVISSRKFYDAMNSLYIARFSSRT